MQKVIMCARLDAAENEPSEVSQYEVVLKKPCQGAFNDFGSTAEATFLAMFFLCAAAKCRRFAIVNSSGLLRSHYFFPTVPGKNSVCTLALF